MEHKLFNEIKSDERIRVVSITKEQAEILNSRSKETGISYELKDNSSDNDKNVIDIESYTLQLGEVIEAYNELEEVKKVGKNTGAKKMSELIEKLSDEQITELLNKVVK